MSQTVVGAAVAGGGTGKSNGTGGGQPVDSHAVTRRCVHKYRHVCETYAMCEDEKNTKRTNWSLHAILSLSPSFVCV